MAEICDLHPDIGFPHDGNDLFFVVSRLLHERLLSLTEQKSEVYSGMDLWRKVIGLVAEDFETPAQLAFPLDKGYYAAQGDLVSQPLAVEKLIERINLWERVRSHDGQQHCSPVLHGRWPVYRE